MQNRTRWILGSVLVALIAALLYTVITPRDAEDKKISFVIPTSVNPYWQAVESGAKIAEEGLPDNWAVNVRAGSEDTDTKQQIRILRSFLRSNPPGALVLGPASSSAVVPIVKQYNERNIPVVIIDSELDSVALADNNTHYELFIGSRNKQGGKKASRRIEKHLEGIGSPKVRIIGGSTGHETAIARRNGFIEGASGSWDIEVENADWDRKKANSVMRKFVEEGSPDAVFAASDEMALGAVDALKSLGIPQAEWPILVGFDATEAGVDAVRAGELCATVAQQPEKIAQRAVENARMFAEGEDSEPGRKILVDTKVVPDTVGDCR
jgi:ABC-type sugar transport system substrate-binding protein